MSAQLQIPPNLQAANAPIFSLCHCTVLRYCYVAFLRDFRPFPSGGGDNIKFNAALLIQFHFDMGIFPWKIIVKMIMSMALEKKKPIWEGNVHVCKHLQILLPPLTHPECKYLETCQILKSENICDDLNDKISKKIKWFKSH